MITRPSATAIAFGRGLGRDIDHARFALGAEMGEASCLAAAPLRSPGRERTRRRAPAARASRRRRRPAASGFRRPGTSKCPAAASRARSAGAKMPLSPTITRSAGISGASRSQVASVVSKVCKFAVVDADQPRFEAAARASARARHAPRPARPCRARRLPLRARPRAASSSAAMMIRMQSAPVRARLGHLIGVEHEILAQRRQRAGGARRAQMIEASLGTRARRSAPKGRSRRPAHKPPPGPADRNRRGSGPSTGSPS